MRAKLLITAALGAAALALPSGASADDLIVCTGSIDGERQRGQRLRQQLQAVNRG